MARTGIQPGYQVHDSLAVPGRLTASLAERLQVQAYNVTTAATLARLQRHEAAA
jgi:hypothetical protein